MNRARPARISLKTAAPFTSTVRHHLHRIGYRQHGCHPIVRQATPPVIAIDARTRLQERGPLQPEPQFRVGWMASSTGAIVIVSRLTSGW